MHAGFQKGHRFGGEPIMVNQVLRRECPFEPRARISAVARLAVRVLAAITEIRHQQFDDGYRSARSSLDDHGKNPMDDDLLAVAHKLNALVLAELNSDFWERRRSLKRIVRFGVQPKRVRMYCCLRDIRPGIVAPHMRVTWLLLSIRFYRLVS
jgi:hypothetical protein